ncbi:peptidase domain-containing ABC transporter [Chromobacterium sp. IIBBL 290-4]|uniref:peptidase domain-containing ABC transporter n=1 Tax=Chromobacterium sp. IIBBL 290-4 TaxID=2953890 RepID=UPI0020B678CA|nr:peptidase domain-containing ABC transporter [Chromobacterium sp. IIBBL 290-4]UTH74971.1 peptidase domain-containing ABC transporter [Chromobacterium sp. IIBBL 290-4]
MLDALQYGFGRRLPMLLQTEAAECGLACLTMIASFHGHVSDIASLRRRYAISAKGATLKQLVEHADALHLASRPLRLELDELDQLQTPCILHWDLNHFVVLKRVAAGRVEIHDPAFGARKLSFEETSRHFTGVALELSPTPQFEKKEEKQDVSLRALVGQVLGLKRSIFQVVALSAALEVMTLLAPFFQQWVIDGVIVQNDRDLLKVMALGFLMLMLVQMLVGTLRSWLVIYFSTQLNMQWVASVFTRLLGLPMSYFEKRHLGDVLSRFGAINTIRQTLTTTALSSILDGVMAVLALAMMLFYSVQLAMITLLALTIYILIRAATYAPFKQANEEQIVLSAREQSHFMESIRGAQSIKLFNRESDRRSQWLNLVVNSTNRGLATQRMSTLYQLANGLIFGLEGILVTYFGALLVMDHQFSIGMMFAYGSYKMQFSSRVGGLVDLFFQIRMLRIQRERLADIVLSEPESAVAAGSVIEEADAMIPPALELRGVRFRHAEGEPWILDGVDLSIAAGESMAITGPSGCGKTTLLKVMLGLLKPSQGEVLVDGVPMQSLGLKQWRSRLGAVMQEDQLFAGSIAENIAFSANSPDMERVQVAARMAAVHQDVLAMPMAYQTLIGDMGAVLSGGQKQRLLLARALHKRPSILFLDEATSHLDVENEYRVNQSLRDLPLTRVVIAHRPETIAMADRVVAMAGGRIASGERALASERLSEASHA